MEPLCNFVPPCLRGSIFLLQFLNMTTALTNATIFTGSEEVKDKAVLIENSKIRAIVDFHAIPKEAEIRDYSGYYIAPGLIDLQIYGGGGYLFSNKPSAEALKAMGDALVKTGTTAFMLTLATNSTEIFREAIRVVKNNPHPALLGLHLEGPYLNPVKKGAHIEQYIRVPKKEEVLVFQTTKCRFIPLSESSQDLWGK